jgi:ABC-type oligopeptide transport system substrate-binding subunit
MLITLKLLKDKRACARQCEIFATEWPDGCTISLATVRKALSLKLDLDWAATNLLNNSTLKVYNEAVATAWRTYDEARATAERTYNEARATALKTYNEAVSKAFVKAARVHDKLAKNNNE